MNQSRKSRKAFDIPGINNEKCVLMRHLKLNENEDEDYRSVIECEKIPAITTERARFGANQSYQIAVFEYAGSRYHVSPAVYGMEGKTCMSYNGATWAIHQVEATEQITSKEAA